MKQTLIIGFINNDFYKIDKYIKIFIYFIDMKKDFTLINLLNLCTKIEVPKQNLNKKKIQFNQSFFFNKIINDNFYFFFINNELNFYFNLLYILNLDSNNETLDINNQSINKLIFNINQNKQFFKILKKGCKRNLLINFIENREENDYILQYFADSFNINIIVLDTEINKIVCYYNDNNLDKFKNFFIFAKLNNKHCLLFKKEQFKFGFDEIPWFFDNLNICERCNLNCKIEDFIYII